MEQVVVEAGKARDGFKSDPVHDLRVAIRRCRSMAEGFAALDPEPTWKKMRRAAKPLFSALGNLRDVQVQMEWVEKLGEEGNPIRAKLADHLGKKELELKDTAETALNDFDVITWQQWATQLEERSKLLPAGGEVFQVMALERWRDARRLQSVALRNRSKTSLHALRIGIKKFRYIVENFLPELYEGWHKELKGVQDTLGEVHDLDVLGDTARTLHVFESPQQRQQWISTLQRERKQRVDAYRAKMLGKKTAWDRWRDKLPKGEALHAANLKTFEVWSQFRDPDVAHTRRVLSIAMNLFDVIPEQRDHYQKVSWRDLLTVAVLTHEVGHGAKRRHNKETVHMLDRLVPPPEWSAIHLHLAGMIARYHRGALPNDAQKLFAGLPADAKPVVNLLGGIIRLADSLEPGEDVAAAATQITRSEGAVKIRLPGYEAHSRKAEKIAAARHLLESTIGIPIIVQSMT